MATFFTSDTHFGHANIIKLCQRPYASVEEMDAALIANWNEIVKPEDTVYHLGDFAFRAGGKRAAEIAHQLNGTIWITEGNHEEDLLDAYKQGWLSGSGIHFLPRYHETKIEGQKIVMCHYAMRTWHHDLRGVWHLYGHSHGGLEPLGRSMDVGVDVTGYRPLGFAALKVLMDARPIHSAPKFEGYQPTEEGQETCQETCALSAAV